MNQNEFDKFYLSTLLEKIKGKIEQFPFLVISTIFLDYEKHSPTNEFGDSLSLNMFLPYIFLPTRITSNSKTFNHNIFSNHEVFSLSNEVISGNVTATIPDHLPQVLIAPDTFCVLLANKTNIFERN